MLKKEVPGWVIAMMLICFFAYTYHLEKKHDETKEKIDRCKFMKIVSYLPKDFACEALVNDGDEMNINDFIIGQLDAKAGKQSIEKPSESYLSGYSMQYQLEQNESHGEME